VYCDILYQQPVKLAKKLNYPKASVGLLIFVASRFAKFSYHVRQTCSIHANPF